MAVDVKQPDDPGFGCCRRCSSCIRLTKLTLQFHLPLCNLPAWSPLSAGQPESHYQVAGLLSDILASSVSGSPPASEMSKLYRMYWPHQQQQQEAAIAVSSCCMPASKPSAARG